MTHGLGQVVAVCISDRTGEQKRAVKSIQLVEDYGIVGDAHVAASGKSAYWPRKVLIRCAIKV